MKNLDYLMGNLVKNLKGETGSVINVTSVGSNYHLTVKFDSGRIAEFCYLNNGNYITKYLTFMDKDVRDRLSASIAEEVEAKEEEKRHVETKNIITSVTSDYASDGAEIRFGKTHELYGAFSNFKGATFYDGRQYKCSEAAWQSLKTLDPSVRDEFASLSGSAAKAKGRKVKLRPDWEQVKDDFMVDVCYAKFSQNEDLKKLLLSTGNSKLIENTTGWHDNYWGDCQCAKCINKTGLNHLGIALMRVREQLRIEAENSK